MRIGIVGARRIGATAGRQWAAAGHELVVSFARDEGRLAALAEELGARTGTPAEAAAFGEVVLFAPSGREGDERVVLPLCGDDADAKQLVAGLIEDSGFAPLDRGPLSAAGGQEPGGPLFGTPTTVGDGAAPAAPA
jgi:predicted dinucleotide-binding enzyme